MNERGTTGSLVMTVVVSLLMLGGDIKVASAAGDDTAECPCPAAVAEASSGLNHLGISYAKGMQGKRNPQLAMRFFLRAAMQGYTPAMANLGTLYQTGALGRKNFPRAYAWVRAALSFGVPEQDHDITVMKLGMIAARLKPAEIEQSEGLAETIAVRILEACNCSPSNETALALNADVLSQAAAARGVSR